MAKFEDLLERVKDLDEDLAAEFEEFKGSSLRKKAEERDAFEAKVKELEAREAERDAIPARQKAFATYGIDFDRLSKLERKALEGYDGELTEEAIAAFVEENELPLVEGTETEEVEESEAQKVARAARRAAGGGRGAVIEPGDTADWSTEKLIDFRNKHPEEYEALKRGETVTGVIA